MGNNQFFFHPLESFSQRNLPKYKSLLRFSRNLFDHALYYVCKFYIISLPWVSWISGLSSTIPNIFSMHNHFKQLNQQFIYSI
ncbi:hypothetical protein XELAEV_18005437mg [Xenopus laevis]|uniref:Uncharacterized protein n=1 Tax=Xenopus laevis TaxID=8355 RepID=A0A974DWV6_XENLA|nr:hypothetical protein XELAEV_18005437mg [Xenopus laevis]